MDRYSLGISFGRQKARAVVFNIDKSTVEDQVVVKIPPSENEILGLLSVVDQLFLALSKSALLKQVAMIKVSGPEDLGVCSSDHFYKSLMTFSAYAKSLESHFENSFPMTELLKPQPQNNSYAKEWANKIPHEFKLPENALLFTLKSLVSGNPNIWRQTTNVQFLSSFITSILAGKRAPIDSSCGKISGMLNNENKWCDTNTRWVSDDLINKLDDIKHSYDNFSYVSAYFSEKYGIYREARVLTAGGNSAASALGAGGTVYLDTEDSLHLGAIVKNVPLGNGSFYLNGILPGQSICIVASNFDLLISQIPLASIEVDNMKNLYSAELINAKKGSIDFNKKIKMSSLIFSQLAELKSNSKEFDKIYVTGELSNNLIFLQACADLFSSEIIAFENSEFGAAIGNALNAARKIKEAEYESVMKVYFDATNHKIFTPSNEGLNQMLSQYIAYLNI